MMQDQFQEEVLERLDKLDRRFDKLDRRFDKLDGRVEELSQEVGAVKTRLSGVEEAVHRIARKVGVPSIPALGGSGQPMAAGAR